MVSASDPDDAADGSAVALLPPSPDGGALEFTVSCASVPGRRGEHPLVVGPDWTVEVPHDLDAERVAVAFGGRSRCLELVERGVPAIRAALPMLTRQVLAPIRRLATADWAADRSVSVPGCCPTLFRSARHAATHLRGTPHLARASGAAPSDVRDLLKEFAAAWTEWEGAPPPWPGVARLVREEDGVAELWEAGIHPRLIARLAASAVGVDEPLPVSYYLALAYGSVDREWLATVVQRRPDADTAAWLATLPGHESTGPAHEWAAWLGYGIPRLEVRHAVATGMPAATVPLAVATTDWPAPMAARNVLAWALAGCRPTPEHYGMLARRGHDHARPSRGTIDAAVLDVADALRAKGGTPPAPDRTEVAVMLELLGSRPALLAAVRRGLLTAAALEEAPDLLPYSRTERTP